jgi:hypothetical protein
MTLLAALPPPQRGRHADPRPRWHPRAFCCALCSRRSAAWKARSRAPAPSAAAGHQGHRVAGELPGPYLPRAAIPAARASAAEGRSTGGALLVPFLTQLSSLMAAAQRPGCQAWTDGQQQSCSSAWSNCRCVLWVGCRAGMSSWQAQQFHGCCAAPWSCLCLHFSHGVETNTQ